MYPTQYDAWLVGPEPYVPEEEAHAYLTTVDMALNDLSRHDILALDTETDGLDPLANNLVLVQIATPDDCYLFPADLPNLADHLRPLFTAQDRRWLVQYSPFDAGFMIKHLGLTMASIYDTWYVERAIRTSIKDSAGLKGMVKRYLGLDISKEERTSFKLGQPLTEDQIQYAAIDALALFPIALRQALYRAITQPVAPWDELQQTYNYIKGRGPKPTKSRS